MSNAKTSINLPKSIGGFNLVDSFNKINLSEETKDFLAALNARLSATWNPGASIPTLEVVNSRGEMVCSINEFIKLGGYRRWVSDELKRIDKESSSSERVTLMAMYFQRAGINGDAPPERIVEANGTKFNQFRSMIDHVSANLEVIDECIDNKYKTYLVKKGKQLIIMLHKLMLDCVRPQKVEKEVFDDYLFQCAIPKWLQNKLVDKQFTTNLKVNAVSLLFPKGNYLKAISLTTKELNSESFLARNKTVVEKSGAIIAFAKKDFTFILPKIPRESQGDVKHFYDNMMWTLNSPYSFNEILEVRVGGKAPPSFRERQKPNPRMGSKARPETDTQRICREVYNTIGKLTSTFLHFQNLTIQVSDPLEEFWKKLYPGISWEITPSRGIYLHVKESGIPMKSIKDLTSDPMLALMSEVMCQNLKVSVRSNAGLGISVLVDSLKNKSDYIEQKNVKKNIPDLDIKMMTIEEHPKIPEEVLNKTRTFLGLKNKKKKSSKKKFGSRNSVRLSAQTLVELSVIKERNDDMYFAVKEWLASTFKTGKKAAVQEVAAGYVVGEVLRHQNKLLGEDFDEFVALQEVEEYEES